MAFTIVKRLGLIPILYNSPNVNYGIIFGNLDLVLLNAIYDDITETIMPYQFDEWEDEYRQALREISYEEQKVSRAEIINSLSPLIPLAEYYVYRYYTIQCSSLSILRYCLEATRLQLPPVWFKEFLPEIEYIQLNNNPRSDLDPFVDPNINWKVMGNGFIDRTLWTFLNHTYFKYKLI